jgi:hypothetical protein
VPLDERQLPPDWVPPPPKPGEPPPTPEEAERQEDLHAAVIEERLKMRAQEEQEAHRAARVAQIQQSVQTDSAKRRKRLGKVGLACGVWTGLLSILMCGPVPLFFYTMCLAGAASGILVAWRRAGHLLGMVVFGTVPVGTVMLALALQWIAVGVSSGHYMGGMGGAMRFFSGWLFLVLTGAAVSFWARDLEDQEKNPF